MSVGCMHLLDNVGKEDAVAIEFIKLQGGIPFVKSNVPQLILAMETTNEVYGTAMNPHNIDRSCSGSSGGEGGLVAAKCSPLGIGTDIGGSIR